MNEKMKQPTTKSKEKTNATSSLLTKDENEQVFSLLGAKCQSLATSVVQIYVTESAAHSQWRKKHTAVLCFIKDSFKRSYFMRGYCLIRNELCFEHELYDAIKIHKTRPYLLTFEGESGHVAFNFASEEECFQFFRVAEFIIENRARKRLERRSRPKPPMTPQSGIGMNEIKNKTLDNVDDGRVKLRNNSNTTPFTPISATTTTTTSTSTATKILNNFKERDKKKAKKYSKSDIGTPTNFVHVSHVGFNPATKPSDLDESENEELLKEFLMKAGVSEKQLNDRDTREFILDFVKNHNVIESYKLESNAKQVEPAKAKAPAPAPPPVKKREYNGSGQRTAPPPPPPVPTRQPPPPVPTTAPPQPARGPPPTRPPPINVQSTVVAPTVPSLAPPPPPPPPSVVAPPPPPPMPTQSPVSESVVSKSNLPVLEDSRSALMDSIRKGIALKKVDPATLSTGSGGDPRSDLLSEIRQGTVLRPVQDRELPAAVNRDSNNSGGGTDALADALRRALLDRSRVIHSSEEDTESSDNEDEWED